MTQPAPIPEISCTVEVGVPLEHLGRYVLVEDVAPSSNGRRRVKVRITAESKPLPKVKRRRLPIKGILLD